MCGLWDVPRNKIAVKIFIMIIFAESGLLMAVASLVEHGLSL